MKNLVSTLLVTFYSIGTFLLPMGDFSILKDLPAMYQHCKSMEDIDMTPIDFITDHLINIDGLFDKHDNGDQQKPHSPLNNHHYGSFNSSFLPSRTISFYNLLSKDCKPPIIKMNVFSSNYFSRIFRPPIVI